MKKLVPFRKELEFNTEVAEITSISLEHTLQKIEEDFISGDLVLTGEYKIVDVSLNTEKFDFKIPFDINIDNHYDTKNLVIDIDDFYYELKDDKMVVNISILLDHLEEKDIERTISQEIEETKKEVIDLKEEAPKEMKREEVADIKIATDVFSNIDSEEAYRTYKVYIVRENDTIEQILEQFKVTREDLENYNDLSSIAVGLKLIIPTNKDEKI